MRVLAIDIGGTAIKFGVLEEGKFLSRGEMPSRAREGGQALVERVLRLIGRQREGVQRVGVSTMGMVQQPQGRILFATEAIPGWSGMMLRDRLQQGCGLPVVVENDVNAMALGEAHYGAGRGYQDFLCLAFGTGVGGAIVQDGAIYHGPGGYGGEFGHMTIHAGGRRCACGRLGCYEAYAKVPALTHIAAGKLRRRHISGRELFGLIEQGDLAAQEALQLWLGEVCLGLASLVHIFNPALMVLGGGVMEQEAVIRQLQQMLPPLLMEGFTHVRLCGAQLGNRAGMFGAYHLAMQQNA